MGCAANNVLDSNANLNLKIQAVFNNLKYSIQYQRSGWPE
ncbi:hypothetical protein D1BOALGB6SA_6116 [Olavius sp. associated proteobacterium Delta 1]|nr:hypothetical protein D1BOALGB6SA_6116 [Olavius sp. associated proteobacterium Delta 1]